MQPENETKIVIIVLPKLSHGGAERVMIKVANALAQRVGVYVLTKDPDGPLSATLSPQVKILKCRGSKLWLWDVLRFSRSVRPNVILSSFWDVNVFLIFSKLLLPAAAKVYLRESIDPLAHLATLKLHTIYKAIYRYCYTRADAIIAPSTGVANQIRRTGDGRVDNIYVIENSPDLQRLDKYKLAGVTEAEKYIVSVGRLTQQKGFDLLIRSFSLSQMYKEGFRLVIVGEGPEKQALLRLIDELDLSGAVEISNTNHDSLSVVSKASFYLLSSRYEGLSNAMLEALALGVPVIATTKNTSADEYIIERENGVLVRSTEVPALVESLDAAYLTINHFNRQQIADAAVARFSNNDAVPHYLKLIIG